MTEPLTPAEREAIRERAPFEPMGYETEMRLLDDLECCQRERDAAMRLYREEIVPPPEPGKAEVVAMLVRQEIRLRRETELAGRLVEVLRKVEGGRWQSGELRAVLASYDERRRG